MNSKNNSVAVLPWGKGGLLLLLGVLLVAGGWIIPSRFKSIPPRVLAAAGEKTDSMESISEEYLLAGELGVASVLVSVGQVLELPGISAIKSRLAIEQKANPLIGRWGVWDPFLEAALSEVALEQYSKQPGAIGVVLAKPCRESLSALLENSKLPLVGEILESGSFTQYKRLFPVNSSSGRALESSLLLAALLAQNDTLSSSSRKGLRLSIWNGKADGDIGELEDFYLNLLSLGRLFDWGQLQELVGYVEHLDTLGKLRYVFQVEPESKELLYAACIVSEDPEGLVAYLGEFGKSGLEAIRTALESGQGSLRLLLRKQLPVEEFRADTIEGAVFATELAEFSLQNPDLSLGFKYALYFLGAFACFWGSSAFTRIYRDTASPMLSYMQRVFASSASVMVLIVLSEPFLAGAVDTTGYSFKFVVPVIAQVDGETQIVETSTSIDMDPKTLITIAFFFALQIMVFMICLLKVREIDRKQVEDLIKLKLIENEENLFDAGLYVGIAGTCISLVLQVLGLIEPNLLAAYSSNLFGILGVATVKIRLVRPVKSRLIIASEERLLELSGKTEKAG